MLQPGSTLELSSRRPRNNQSMIVAGRTATGTGLLLVCVLLLNQAGALPQIAPHTILSSPGTFIAIAVVAPVALWAGVALLSNSKPWVNRRSGRVNHAILIAGVLGAIFGTAWLALVALALTFYPG